MSHRQAGDPPEPLSGWRWWTGLAVGGAVGLFGLAGLVRDAAKTLPAVWLTWLVGLLLVHDVVFAPLVTSGVLVLASVPVLVGVGRATQPGNGSVLPGDYPLALAGVLAVVWLGVLAFGIWGVVCHRR